MYGHKQGPQAWYFKLDQYLRDSRFRKIYSKPTLYVKINGDNIVLLIVYANELAINRSNVDVIQQVKSDICYVFEVTDLGTSLFFRCRFLAIWSYYICITSQVCHSFLRKIQNDWMQSYIYTYGSYFQLTLTHHQWMSLCIDNW